MTHHVKSAVRGSHRSWFKVPEKSQGLRHTLPRLAFVQVRRGVVVPFLQAFRCPGRDQSLMFVSLVPGATKVRGARVGCHVAVIDHGKNALAVSTELWNC